MNPRFRPTVSTVEAEVRPTGAPKIRMTSEEDGTQDTDAGEALHERKPKRIEERRAKRRERLKKRRERMKQRREDDERGKLRFDRGYEDRDDAGEFDDVHGWRVLTSSTAACPLL